MMLNSAMNEKQDPSFPLPPVLMSLLVKFMRSVADALLILFILLSPFVWILRDGFGPDAMESNGILAFKRAFLTFYWGPITLTSIIVSILGRLYLRSSANKTAA
jgi:hypothetical protein